MEFIVEPLPLGAGINVTPIPIPVPDCPWKYCTGGFKDGPCLTFCGGTYCATMFYD